MPVLPVILSREIICGLPWIGKKLFICRRERWHPNRAGIREANSHQPASTTPGRGRPIASFSLLRSNRVAFRSKADINPGASRHRVYEYATEVTPSLPRKKRTLFDAIDKS